MRSQAKIIASHIRNFNESDADAAVDKLISVFSGQSTLPQEVYQVANIYKDAGQSSRAIQLYQRVAQTWPDDNSAILSQEGIAMINISLDHDAAVDAVIGAMIVDFNDHPLLPKVVFRIGEKYFNMALQNKNKGLAAESEENFLKAIAVCERIILELSPSGTMAETYLFSGVCYRRIGQHRKAIEYYQKVVSDWPDYRYAWSAQMRIAFTYEYLRNNGIIPQSEADILIKAAFEAVVENYPNCPAAPAARSRLNSNRFQHPGQEAFSLLKPPPPPPILK